MHRGRDFLGKFSKLLIAIVCYWFKRKFHKALFMKLSLWNNYETITKKDIYNYIAIPGAIFFELPNFSLYSRMARVRWMLPIRYMYCIGDEFGVGVVNDPLTIIRPTDTTIRSARIMPALPVTRNPRTLRPCLVSCVFTYSVLPMRACIEPGIPSSKRKLPDSFFSHNVLSRPYLNAHWPLFLLSSDVDKIV